MPRRTIFSWTVTAVYDFSVDIQAAYSISMATRPLNSESLYDTLMCLDLFTVFLSVWPVALFCRAQLH